MSINEVTFNTICVAPVVVAVACTELFFPDSVTFPWNALADRSPIVSHKMLPDLDPQRECLLARSLRTSFHMFQKGGLENVGAACFPKRETKIRCPVDWTN